MRQIAKPRPAIGFRHGDAVQAEFADFRPQVFGKEILAIDRIGARRDFGLGKGAHAVAQHVERFAVIEAELVQHGSGNPRGWRSRRPS